MIQFVARAVINFYLMHILISQALTIIILLLVEFFL